MIIVVLVGEELTVVMAGEDMVIAATVWDELGSLAVDWEEQVGPVVAGELDGLTMAEEELGILGACVLDWGLPSRLVTWVQNH